MELGDSLDSCLNHLTRYDGLNLTLSGRVTQPRGHCKCPSWNRNRLRIDKRGSVSVKSYFIEVFVLGYPLFFSVRTVGVCSKVIIIKSHEVLE